MCAITSVTSIVRTAANLKSGQEETVPWEFKPSLRETSVNRERFRLDLK
jgi:hypothetical protein